MSKNPRRPGRPPEPVPEDAAEALLLHLHAGGTLKHWCESYGITPMTVSNWKAKDAEFALAYARAREDGATIRFDHGGEIVAKATPETVQVAKLQADHEYRAARSFCPRIFGDKAHVEHGGGFTLEVVTGVPREPREPSDN